MKSRQPDTFSERLRALLAERPESLAEIGRSSGVSHTALSRFLRGERGLTTRSLDRLCACLGLELGKAAKRRGT